MYYFDELELSVGGSNILAQSVELSSSTSTSATRYYDNEIDYTIDGGISSRASFSFLITSNDPLYEGIENDTPITVNFGGFVMNSGYVTNYSVEVSPNGLCMGNAELVSFHEITGSMTGGSVNYSEVIEVAHGASIYMAGANTFANLSTEAEATGFLGSMRFQLSSDVQPEYVIDEELPHNVVFLDKRKTLSVQGPKLGPVSSWTGMYTAFSVDLKSEEGGVMQTYSITGRVIERNFATSIDNYAIGSVSIFEVR